jgi:pimeloyl-ACP methyl ester carboxylesterase
MENFFLYKNCRIHYKLLGQGNCVVLIHGYLENLDIWNGFADQLSKHCKVLMLDLPQHGKSNCDEEVNSMEQLAESVNATLSHLNIPKAMIVGHSMGGYLALAFAELFPKKIAGLCLFHSTPNADSFEKKQARMKEVEQVINGEKSLIIENGILLRFAEKNILTLHPELERAKNIALTVRDKGIIGTLKAMASRPDRNRVIENSSFPTLMIFGAMDHHIPMTIANELAAKHKKTRTVILDNSGHMGFIEEKDQALNAIKSFLAVVFS